MIRKKEWEMDETCLHISVLRARWALFMMYALNYTYINIKYQFCHISPKAIAYNQSL